jgi:hypothetical protein
MMRVRFPLPAPVSGVADIAQLVERTLGKGEVGSSTLPISTSLRIFLITSFICQKILFEI